MIPALIIEEFSNTGLVFILQTGLCRSVVYLQCFLASLSLKSLNFGMAVLFFPLPFSARELHMFPVSSSCWCSTMLPWHHHPQFHRFLVQAPASPGLLPGEPWKGRRGYSLPPVTDGVDGLTSYALFFCWFDSEAHSTLGPSGPRYDCAPITHNTNLLNNEPLTGFLPFHV